MFKSVLLPFVILATPTSLGCHSAHGDAHARPRYPVTHPKRMNTELVRDYVGQLKSIQHIELRAMARGYVQGIFADEGQAVPKGTRMFQIMPTLYQAEVQRATAEAALTAIELNNTTSLADKHVVSANELAMARARADKANAEVALTTTHRALTEIRAPFDGIMGRFHVRMGSLVDDGDLLTTLSDNREMWVYFNVSEAEYLDYRAQPSHEARTPVRLLLANGQRYEHTGWVETIEADFNNDTGAIAFRARFPNPRGLLRHGETGKVLMSVPLSDALVIPKKATFDVLDKTFVFVVDAANVVHSRAITVATEQPHLFVIARGLEANETILLDGLRKVRDGAVIDTDYHPPEEVLGHLEVEAE